MATLSFALAFLKVASGHGIESEDVILPTPVSGVFLRPFMVELACSLLN